MLTVKYQGLDASEEVFEAVRVTRPKHDGPIIAVLPDDVGGPLHGGERHINFTPLGEDGGHVEHVWVMNRFGTTVASYHS